MAGMTTYLDLEAALATPFVHPGGAVATAHLLSSLDLGPGVRALDLGCGTGATVAEAGRTGAAVIGLDLRPSMLAAARRRNGPLRLVRADLEAGLPFVDSSFDAVWAESVVALLDPPRVVAEMARVLRPGGRIAVNERIWKPGVTTAEAARINALSMRCFGVPAAAADPLDRGDWAALLGRCGIDLEQVTAVDDLLHRSPVLPVRTWLARQLRYVNPPTRLVLSLGWRWCIRRHRAAWARLESWLFIGRRTA
jgi:SAM-dependent methyltransferase